MPSRPNYHEHREVVDEHFASYLREHLHNTKRIVCIEGTHSTGKSKLCEELGRLLQMPVVDEIARKVFAKHSVDSSYKGCDPGRIAMIQREIMDGYYNAMSEPGPFIIDRSVLSVYAYSCARLAHHPVQNELTDQWVCCDIAVQDERIYWLRTPILWPVVHDGVREISTHKQRTIDFMLLGMMESMLPHGFKTLTDDSTPENRAKQVIYLLST